MSQVPCTGHKCLICEIIGPPDVVEVWVEDLNDGGKKKPIFMKKGQAEKLGLIERTLNEDCVCPSCQHDPPGLCKPDCVCPCHA